MNATNPIHSFSLEAFREKAEQTRAENTATSLNEAHRLAESGTAADIYRAGAIFAELPRAELAIVRASIKKRLGDEFNLNEFGTIVKEANGCAAAGRVRAGTGSNAPLEDIERDGLNPTLADTIAETLHVARDPGGELYRYDGGVYVPGAAKLIRERVKATMKAWKLTNEWTKHRGEEVVAYITADAPEVWMRPPSDQINLLNGILNTTTRSLAPHTPAFLSTAQLPIRFDPKATCPNTERFVSQVYPEDAVTAGVPWMLRAYLLTPTNAMQKAFLFMGGGGNGKSRELAAIRALLGERNCSAASLHRLESDRFAVTDLLGKLANVCPDLPTEDLAGSSAFKALTGGDRMRAERKYQAAFEVEPYARLVFSANEYPRSSDRSDGFFRRWMVLPFDRVLTGDGRIPEATLDAMLADPAELSGVLNKCLAVLATVTNAGVTETPSMERARMEMRSMTDPLPVWIGRACHTHSDASIPCKLLRDRWNQYAAENGYPEFTRKGFGSALKGVLPRLQTKQRNVMGEKVWCYIGIQYSGLGAGQGEGDEGEAADVD